MLAGLAELGDRDIDDMYDQLAQVSPSQGRARAKPGAQGQRARVQGWAGPG